MKALVLAGGRGSRINEISDTQNKCMIPLLGKPLIEYNLDIIAGLDVSEVIIVVGYRAEEIINQYGNSYRGKCIKYVIQWEQKGLVHAIECSSHLLDDDFLITLGDEILISPQHQAMIERFHQQRLFGICGVIPVEDRSKIRKTYSIFQDDRARIFRLIEKPSQPLNNLMGTGNCIFKKEIVSYIPRTPINQQRKEKELPDLVQCAVDEGCLVESFIVGSNYVNINAQEDLLEAECYLKPASEGNGP